MMNIFSDDVRRDPYPLYAKLRSKTPVMRMPQSEMWMLLDYDSVKRALHDHDAFSSSAVAPTGKAPDWLVFLDPPVHTQLRAIIVRAFTPRTIAELEPRVQELSRTLLNQTIERGTMDLVSDYAGPLPTLIIAELLGLPRADRARHLRWSEAIVNLSHALWGGEEAAQALRTHAAVKAELGEYLTALLTERRKDPQDDLLSRLALAEVDGEHLTGDALLGFFQLLLSAGTETTTHLIGNAVLSFLDHPEQLARLRAEPDLLPLAIEEIVRYRAPGQLMCRMTRREIELHGQVIPAGQLVLAMVGAANRDPKQFHEPDRFDIARNPNPHLSFGHGIHFCLGAALARLAARIAIKDLLDRVKNFSRQSDAPWPPCRAPNLHGAAQLPLRFDPGKKLLADPSDIDLLPRRVQLALGVT